MDKVELSPQRELFAQEVAKGKNYSEAYRIAYPKSLKWKDETLWPKASHLADDDKVIARIKQLQAPIEEKTRKTLEDILVELEELKSKALDKEDDKLALDCLKHYAKLSGYEIIKQEVNDTTDYSALLAEIKE